jgi:hypothetical protein
VAVPQKFGLMMGNFHRLNDSFSLTKLVTFARRQFKVAMNLHKHS